MTRIRPSVLVTGAGGMVGANLCRRLVAEGCSVGALVRPGRMPPRLAPLADRLTMYPCDLSDGETVAAAVKACLPDVVFHLAATAFNPPPTIERHLAVNVLGTANLLEAVRTGCQGSSPRIVYTGSVAQYGGGNGLTEDMPDRPATLLGATKSCAATLLHAYGRLHGLHTVELRLFTPYGPMESPRRLVPYTVLSALRGVPVALSGGDQERDFLYIDDATDALARAMTAPLPAQTVLNICSGVPVSVKDMAQRILARMGNPVPLQVGAHPPRPDEIHRMSGDNRLAGELLGWTPSIRLDDGLDRTIDWIKRSGDILIALE